MHGQVIFMAFDDDVKAVAASAMSQKMENGYSWILVEPGAAVPAQGWLTLQPLLPLKGMQAFTEQVRNYTRRYFDYTNSEASTASLLEFSVALHEAILLYVFFSVRNQSHASLFKPCPNIAI